MMAGISVCVSVDNAVIKEINEACGATMTMPDLIAALGSIKTQTNEYLTEIVEANKSQGKSAAGDESQKQSSSAEADNNSRPTVLVVPEKKQKV